MQADALLHDGLVGATAKRVHARENIREVLPERVKEQRGALLATAIVALLAAIAITSLAHPAYRSIFEVFPSRRAVGRPGPPVRSDSPGRPPIPIGWGSPIAFR